MKIEEAIKTLQAAVTARYGTEIETDTGACTLEIAHDRVEMTDRRHHALGGLAGVVRELEKK